MEFELIRRYFKNATLGNSGAGVLVGIGDDCAVLKNDSSKHLCISTDTLICGTHFLENDDPFLLGWKALAVNLSDCAASGATPRWALLAMSIPCADNLWQRRIAEFSKGFLKCAKSFDVALIGGDTTRGCWTITVTILGEAKSPILRSGAQIKDDIWLSGEIGWAACGLDLKLNPQSAVHLLSKDLKEKAFCHLHQPFPRVKLGEALQNLATSAIDLSDGLMGDLRHICAESKCSAHLALKHFPQTLLKNLPRDLALQKMFSCGEDYELLFSAPKSARRAIVNIGQSLQTPLFRIGCFEELSESPIFLMDENGQNIAQNFQGFEHFSTVNQK